MLPPAKPGHFYTQYASTSQKWMSTDSQEQFEKNCQDPGSKAKLDRLGWLNTEIVYNFNQEGFRDEEFDQRPAGIALGCSHTQGIGLLAETCWPSELSKMVGLKVWNLGVSGAALDTCYRLLEYWIHHLNVKFVACLVPEITRYEVYYQNNWSNITPNTIYPRWLEEYQKNWIVCKENAALNRRKNLLAMQHLCHLHNVELFCTHTVCGNADARDLLHHGTQFQTATANNLYEQMKGKIC
jgi:hypothetical protein